MITIHWKKWAKLSIAALTVISVSMGTAGAAENSGCSGVHKMSESEITTLFRTSPEANRAAENQFAEQPVFSSPYQPGKLSQAELDAAETYLNNIRRLAGLNPVQMDSALTENAQYGAALLAAINQMTHMPSPSSKPDDMSQDFFDAGAEATASSNIAMSWSSRGSVPNAPYFIDMWMSDSDSGNISRVGHRRWLLNPALGKVGYGCAAKESVYATIKVFDQNAQIPDYDFISWPASGYFPADKFNNTDAWSVSVNPKKYTVSASDLTVAITRQEDGKTWHLDSGNSYTPSDSGMYMNVETGYYGSGPCIIFRPDDIEAYDGTYSVNINGVQTNSGEDEPIQYDVVFYGSTAATPDTSAQDQKTKTENQKTEDQKTETQKTENQKTENKKTETQKTENQKTENKKTETQKTENQRTESHRTGYYRVTGNPQTGYYEITGSQETGIPGTEHYEKITFAARLNGWSKDEVAMALWEGILPVKALGADYTTKITRSQFAALVVQMTETALNRAIVYAPDSPFTDTVDAWVLKAHAAGIVNGTSATTFSPNASITREQLAAMLYRAIQYMQEQSGTKILTKTGNLSRYTDSNQVQSWAREPMSALCNNGILQGTSATVLAPSSTATIEQAILLAYRVFEII